MSAGPDIRFSGRRDKEQPKVIPATSRVDLNNLIKRVKEEEKKTKRNNLKISAAAAAAVAVFGIILTL